MYQRREILKLAPRRRIEPDDHWLHACRAAMACRFEITQPVAEQDGVRLACAALAEVERLEQQLTVFRDTSEISFINVSST